MYKEKAFDITSAVSRLREGDEKAFSILYDFFRSKVFFTSKKMNLSTEDAEEIVQEVFLIIWKNRQNLNSELSFNAYLLTILKSLIIKKSKKEARRIAYEVYTLSTQEIESNETETQIEYSEFERISISEIEKLPKTQKEIFKMKNYENLHSGEIAEKLGISKRTVESHIYVATKSIKNKLQKKYLIAIKSLAIGMIYYFF
ncbi:sigma-70 family RNA polymerase sigma factor [Aquiflexum gelatinilyticum]|uniref:RNA polymerase sigma factor n=1 Tax=Aquiflexum gelatinilyticum TaxID=2961943 RepID=A0A9X2P3L8_9BACT|nr:sigma-70 family RNA polymerase sigma factor [Aquiflexum gelatinilyticum]MCR9015266.1 sigma-70 family RNA polymerase sigma factor [Aquiflexum gelatinilyticum]